MQQDVMQPEDDKGQSFTIKIQGDKMRLDVIDPQAGNACSIVGFNTWDIFELDNKEKTFIKHDGAKTKAGRERMDKITKAQLESGHTNIWNAPVMPPLDTGQSETVGGYDAEIYSWSNNFGESEKLWVAKDFPNHEKIKTYLDKFDQFIEISGAETELPALSKLPGMVVMMKSYELIDVDKIGEKETVKLVSAKEESVDPSIFEIPSDYADVTPPDKPKQTTSTTTADKPVTAASRSQRLVDQSAVAMIMNDYSQAQKLAADATDVDPKFAEAWVMKAKALVHLGHADDARQSYEQALSIYQEQHQQNPSDAKLVSQQIPIFIWLGRLPEAEVLLKQAHTDYPNDQIISLLAGNLASFEKTWKADAVPPK
jgi:tetratricopeptide (TPR) repeat protein